VTHQQHIATKQGDTSKAPGHSNPPLAGGSHAKHEPQHAKKFPYYIASVFRGYRCLVSSQVVCTVAPTRLLFQINLDSSTAR